jgi:hypothetical protein
LRESETCSFTYRNMDYTSREGLSFPMEGQQAYNITSSLVCLLYSHFNFSTGWQISTKLVNNLDILHLPCKRYTLKKKKGKAVPLESWSGPEGSRKLRFPDFMTTARDGGKVVSLTHRPHLPPHEILLVLISIRG